jgi:hypothetical protein
LVFSFFLGSGPVEEDSEEVREVDNLGEDREEVNTGAK